MNRDSNVYTFLFATLMVLIVASSLAFTASSLKERQISNVRKEKMQNILATIGIETEREEAEALFNKYITEELTLKELSKKRSRECFLVINLVEECIPI